MLSKKGGGSGSRVVGEEGPSDAWGRRKSQIKEAKMGGKRRAVLFPSLLHLRAAHHT